MKSDGIEDSLAALEALVENQDWEDALALGSHLQASAPERFEPWEAIALSYTFTQRHSEAIDAYEAALARYAPRPVELGLMAKQLADFVGLEDRRKGRMLFNLACEYANAGEVEPALGRLAEAIAVSPSGHWRDQARDDSYLDGLRDDPRFVELVSD